MRLHALTVAAAFLSAGLAACDRGAQGPNAPARTGDPPEVARPSAPDTPPGGPAGVKGSLPHPGSSGGDAVPGATGSGSGQTQRAEGLAGGMRGPSGLGMTGTFPSASTTQSAGASPAAEGSANRTPRGGVGSR